MANGGIIGTVNNPTSSTATGVWQQEEQYEAVRDGTWPRRALFTTKSLRFNRGSTDFLNRTMGTAGTSDKIGTYSGWVKRSTTTLDGMFFEGKDLAANNYTQIYFIASGKLTIYGSTGPMDLVTTAVFTDPSAWYHLVVAFDTTQGTASNRVKIYINGTQITSITNGNGDAAQYPAQNSTIYFGVNGDSQLIGKRNDGALYWNGYMSEIIYVDGQALAPTSFGVANSDGVWTPIIYTGSFGNNGFNLQFENASALGTDSSPNGNTFTVNNLTSIDQSTDYPVVNYATLNPLARRFSSTPNTFSDGNLTSAFPAAANSWNPVSATFGMTNGKWYWESKSISGASTYNGIMAQEPTSNTGDVWLGGIANQFGYSGGNGYVYVANSNQASLSSYTNGDTVSVAYDADNNLIYFYKNGAIQNSGTGLAVPTPESTPLGAWFPAWSTWDTAAIVKSFNFGSPPYAISSGNADGNGYGNFEYAVPSGFYALNTANLAEFG